MPFALLVGCASGRNGPFLGEKFDDPPQLSPYNQPLNGGQQQVTPYRGGVPGTSVPPNQYSLFPGPFVLPFGTTDGRGASPALPADDPGRIELGEPLGSGDPENGARPQEPTTPKTYQETVPVYPDAADELPDGGPEQTIRQRPESDLLSAPTPSQPPAATILPNIETVDPSRRPLELQVSDSSQVSIGEAARFEVVIRNPFDTAVESVVVECRFDEGLAFPELTERAIRQRLGTLGALESRTIDLALTAEQVGKQCVDFLLSAEHRETSEVRKCVEVVDLSAVLTPANPVEPITSGESNTTGVRIELVSPTLRNVGGQLECVLTLENRTGHDISGIVASINHDAALLPREVSTGAQRSPGSLVWDLGLLRVDERIQIQVEFACPIPAEQVCIGARVSGRDLATQQQEVCAKIHPRPTLDVAVADSRDPVPVGETTTYLVTVTNRGLDAISDVRVDVELTGGLEFIARTQGLSEVSRSAQPPAGPRTATFAVNGPIAPDDSRVVRVDARATSVGVGGLRVLATELATDRRVIVDEPTVINPPLLALPFSDGIVNDE